MNTPAIFYSSRRGHTRQCAVRIAQAFGSSNPITLVDQMTPEDLIRCPFPICGTPTFGMGDLDFRWELLLKQIPDRAVDGKPCAVFTLGDQIKHTATFVGAMKHLYHHLLRIGFVPLGGTPFEGFTAPASPALLPDGGLPGLALDEMNQPEKTSGRIEAWVQALKQELDGLSEVRGSY